MIKFPCRCGHVFEMAIDQAGLEVQCPACGLLNDVPLRSQLGQLDSDGIYRVEQAAVEPDPYAVADLAYIYQRGARDAQGNEIDLRLASHEFSEIGHGKEIHLTPDGAEPKLGPRYDPETGELVSPLDLKPIAQNIPDQAGFQGDIPMATPALTYALPSQGIPRSPFRLVAMFSPLNMIVILSIFGLHLLLWPLTLVTFAGVFFVVVGIPVMVGLILGHYANVIQAMGPREHDELPRPLGDLRWYEDLWSPFLSTAGALMLCYGLSIILLSLDGWRMSVWLTAPAFLLAAIGTYLFPAVILTLECGGTPLNLRPDRLRQVIRSCGKDYHVAVFAWIVAAVFYAWGWGGSSIAAITAMQGTNLPYWIWGLPITIPVLALGIVAMHYFAVRVALLYRVHQPAFAWVMQHHIFTRDRVEPGLPPSRRRRGKYGYPQRR